MFFLLLYLFEYGLLESSKNTRQHTSDNVLGTDNKVDSRKGSLPSLFDTKTKKEIDKQSRI